MDVVSPDATPARKDTDAALRDHENALSGSAMQMEETKKLLEETAAGASRLLEMNRALRLELDVARAERDAARAEADQTRARARATSEVGGSGSPKTKDSEVAALKTALAEAERNLRTVSAGFRLLRREREEALNVLKGSEATRAALDEERAAVAKMREALTPPTASILKTSASASASASARDDDDDDDDENDPSTESAARLSRRVSRRASSARRATDGPGAPFALPPIGEGDAANEPSAGLSAATGARVSDDEEVHAGSAFGDDDGFEEPFSFAPRAAGPAGAASRRTRVGSARASDLAPPLLASTGRLLARRPESAPPSERMLTNSAARRGEPVAEDAAAFLLNAEGARRPTTARGGRAGSLGEITLRGLGATLPPKHAVSDESEIETNDDDDGDVSEVSVLDSEGSVEDDARATLGSRARVERTRRDPRLDPIRRSSHEKKAGKGDRVVRPEPGSRRIGAGSRVASRGSSRAATPAASPAKPHARNPRRGHGREERERERDDKPAFRPAGIATATRAVPELLTGATLAFAAQRLAAADARFARWAEGAPGNPRLDAGASGVSSRRKHSRGGGKNARRRAQ